MSNPVIFILIIVILQLLYLNGELLKKNEQPLCITTDVLCVKDVILKILKAEKNVAAVADGIEQSIVNIIFFKNFLLFYCPFCREEKREMNIVFNKILIEYENEFYHLQIFLHRNFMINSMNSIILFE